jgi:hypothetical protein
MAVAHQLLQVGTKAIVFSPDVKRALTGAGKAFFSTLAATYLTGGLSITAAVTTAAIFAGMNFFSTQPLPPPQPTPPAVVA